MNRVVFLCVFTVLVTIARAQTVAPDQRFGITFSAGTVFNDPSSWSFIYGPSNVLVRPGFSGGIGLEFGPVQVSGTTELRFSSDVCYSQTQTGVQDIADGTYLARWKRIPIMAWTKLTTRTTLSPYVRVGLGGMKVNFEEIISSNPIWSTSLNYWAFAWGMGAGLDWTLSDMFQMSISVDVIGAEGTQTILLNGYERGLFIRTVEIPVGIRSTVSI